MSRPVPALWRSAHGRKPVDWAGGVTYGRDALRRLREKQERAAQEPERQPSLQDQVPLDAPTDDAAITVWNGERFVAYDRWLATAPIALEEKRPEDGKAINSSDAVCVFGICGGTPVWVVSDGKRWLMYAKSRKAAGRRRDFASPYLEHAIRTAEQWYGVPPGGWRAEKGRDGKGAGANETADLPPQDSVV